MRKSLRIGILGAASVVLLAFSLACSAPEPTPTPVPPAEPAAPEAPAAVATPTPTVAPVATPTPTATPARVLPTPTTVAEGKPVYGGILRFPKDRDFYTLDTAYDAGTGFRRVQYTIYNNLIDLKPDGSFGPELARSWEISPDGKVVTFHLQKGIKFHDGTPLDAQAVKWNYDRYQDPNAFSYHKPELTILERVKVEDDLTVSFYLREAFRPFFTVLTSVAGQIASPSAVMKYKSYDKPSGDFGRNPVGSGPFKFSRWVIDSHVDVVRNENYWERGLPYLDGIRFLLIPDRAIHTAMLRTGEVDLVEELVSTDVKLVEANPRIEVIAQRGVRDTIMYFRMAVKPWNSKPLRQAFAYALDRKTMVDVLYEGKFADVSYNSIGRAHGVWYDDTIKMYEYDPQKAREKLAEAGYATGFSYRQNCASAAFEILACEGAQVMFRQVGIDMTIVPWPRATYAGDFSDGKFDTPSFRAGMRGRVDPHRILERDLCNHPFNKARSAWCNTEYDRLVNEASFIYDVAKAKALYRQAIMKLLEDAPHLSMVSEHQMSGVRRNVKNFAPRPDGEARVREMWIEK